jgi:hypothetical protein
MMQHCIRPVTQCFDPQQHTCQALGSHGRKSGARNAMALNNMGFKGYLSKTEGKLDVSGLEAGDGTKLILLHPVVKARFEFNNGCLGVDNALLTLLDADVQLLLLCFNGICLRSLLLLQ